MAAQKLSSPWAWRSCSKSEISIGAAELVEGHIVRIDELAPSSVTS